MARSDYNEDVSGGYHGIPDAQEREAMSVLQLAEEMVKHQKDSAPYIVLSHELNLKLTREQAQLSHRGAKLNAIFTVIGAIVGAVITAFFSSQSAQQVAHCQQTNDRPIATATSPGLVINNQPSPGPSLAEAPSPPRGKQPNGKPNP